MLNHLTSILEQIDPKMLLFGSILSVLVLGIFLVARKTRKAGTYSDLLFENMKDTQHVPGEVWGEIDLPPKAQKLFPMNTKIDPKSPSVENQMVKLTEEGTVLYTSKACLERRLIFGNDGYIYKVGNIELKAL